ncbi:DJ-1/PfpI family protein [Qipengyuania qiaonensis]|uniref:DJ-1/PfpI family protein n=1 Tax=Qipengyuania qiaonensis TaxID=2867240 RepID=A0ABS7J2Z5_9SPHN|nr:DJ-1/PfpI family protein [Qipengyuania qiaonensis]MBX7481688.1 DJ-1/PfpI family protein [Qipengyuania qiaonensis]
MIDRRTFAAFAALGAIAPSLASARVRAQTAAPPPPDLPPVHDMSAWPADWTGDELVVMLAYPGMTALDLAGPQYMFASLAGAKVLIAAKTLDPVVTDTRLSILPDITLDEVPSAPTILFVPGGISGTLKAMEDEETIAFLAATGNRATYVTSVCTGALLLGQAGLLAGYRATTHWLGMGALPAFGATAVSERVVTDRNRITGGGVTAGIDLGLALLGRLRGDDYARAVQLLAEYAPVPPYDSGTLDTAPPQIVARMQAMFPGFEAHVRAIAQRRRTAR